MSATLTTLENGTSETVTMPGFVADRSTTVCAIVRMASFNASSRVTDQPMGLKPMELDMSRARANSNWLASNSTMTCSPLRDSGGPVRPASQRFLNP